MSQFVEVLVFRSRALHVAAQVLRRRGMMCVRRRVHNGSFFYTDDSMTTALATSVAPDVPRASAPYRNAHWYFLIVLAVTFVGFRPTFFGRLATTDIWHAVHGFTATLWVVALAAQSWLMAHGRVQAHRRVAWVAAGLLITLVVSALYMVGVMQHNPIFPPEVRVFFAFIDLPTLAFFVSLFVLGLRNIATPAAHWRFMSATVLLGLPAALTRAYIQLPAFQTNPTAAFYLSLFTVEVVLVALIVSDWRANERRLAYPLSLAFFVAVHVLIGPVTSTAQWRRAMHLYGSLPMFSSVTR
jgi:hypothetical protein